MRYCIQIVYNRLRPPREGHDLSALIKDIPLLAIIDSDSQADASASGDNVRHVARVAELAGLRIYRISRNIELIGVDDALLHIPTFPSPQPALWIGFMMPPDLYEIIYNALIPHNIFLLNPPAAHLLAEEFDRFYPLISDLTARSITISASPIPESSLAHFSWPVFVKGSVQSLKIEGPKSCFASSKPELDALASRLLAHNSRTRGRVIIREALPLRFSQLTPSGLPAAREFRLFLLHHNVLSCSYYWPMQDPLSKLTSSELHEIKTLASLTSRRLNVPFLAVDIAQLTDLSWTIIEVGDAQFAGLCNTPPFKLINALIDQLQHQYTLP
jgi:hypothetical protein